MPATTKAQAERFTHELREQSFRVAQGLAVAPSSETVGEASSRYLKAIRHHRSWPSIDGRWRLHILPALGAVPVSQVRPTQVEALLARLKDEGYSQQTRRHVGTTLSAFYEWLIKDGVMGANPAAKADIPAVPKGKPKALSPAQIYALAEKASYRGLRDLILLGFYTATRPGELIVGRKEDVHLESQPYPFIRIERTAGSDTTKTGRVRLVPLPVAARQLLASIIREVPGPYLFLNAAGKPMQLREANRAFKSAMRAAGLVAGWEAVCRRKGCGFAEARPACGDERCPRCGFKLYFRALPLPGISLKTLRSSGATQIIRTTGSYRAAMEVLGHSREQTTKDAYDAVDDVYTAEMVDRAFPAPELPRHPGAPLLN